MIILNSLVQLLTYEKYIFCSVLLILVENITLSKRWNIYNISAQRQKEWDYSINIIYKCTKHLVKYVRWVKKILEDASCAWC